MPGQMSQGSESSRPCRFDHSKACHTPTASMPTAAPDSIRSDEDLDVSPPYEACLTTALGGGGATAHDPGHLTTPGILGIMRWLTEVLGASAAGLLTIMLSCSSRCPQPPAQWLFCWRVVLNVFPGWSKRKQEGETYLAAMIRLWW